MSLHKFAEQVAAQGRGDDSLLVHMTPDEVQRLQAFAEANGRTMTINPETGLPEAGFLSDLFKAVAPIALGAFLGPGAFGIAGMGLSAGTAGLITGGITTLATGSLSRGLMAGLGAYGGAGLAQGVLGAGNAQLASTMSEGAQAAAGAGDMTAGMNAVTKEQALSAGAKAVTATPEAFGTFAKSNLGNLAYAASPILAGAMVPTTTKVDAPKNDNYIRQFDFNINPETGKPDPLYGMRAMTPVKANEFGNKTFQGQRDLFRQQNPNPYDIGVASLNRPPQQQMGMAGGGIVALAEGGDPVDSPTEFAPVGGAPVTNNMTVEDLYTQILGRQGEQAGLDYWKQGFGDTVDANEIASFRQAAQAELANRTPAEQLQLAPNLVNNTGIASLGNAGDINYVAKDPGIITATNQYFAANPDVAAAYAVNSYGMTPEQFAQTHYTNSGQSEGRASPLTTTSNSNAYLLANPDVAAAYAKNSYGMTPAELVAYHSTTYGNAEQRATPIAEAQNMVANMYRNVLGRDPDPEGLAFWSNAIAAGRSPESIYKDFLTSARSNTELVTADQVKNATFADATKAYKGYTSTDASNIVDEWVRNTLGRDPTAADKAQQWYKDAYSSMKTQEQAKGLYGQFQGYATKEATTEMANRIKAIDAELKAKNLTEADLLAQTGKTKQQLASEGLNTGLNWMGASQLAPAGSRTAYDLKAKLKALTNTQTVLDTNSQTNAPAGTTNPYGNINNPGDLTFNADGTTTVTPNIPGRPYGGFSGIQEIKDAYTKGGGSLGYTSRVPKSLNEFNQMYNKQTGDSLAAYNYLMGKGANPVKSGVPKLAVPYDEFALGKKTSALSAADKDTIIVGGVKYNLTDPTNPPPADTKGTWTWNVLNKRWIKKAADGTVISDGSGGGIGGDATSGTNSASSSASSATDGNTANSISGLAAAADNSIGVSDMGPGMSGSSSASGSDGAVGTGGMGGEGGDGAGSGGGADNARGGLMPHGSYRMANGGMMGYAIGGGLGSLGSYSDGGRLLKGPGDGVSDSIPATIGRKQQPARLADGEFVIPARIVSELGNGSTDAGAKKLYAMMDRVQRARGKTTGKNKVAANSRSDKYLPA